MERHGNEEVAFPDVLENVKPVRLSLHLIVKRHLLKEAESWCHEKVIEALNNITHLRLDRENIGEIDSLELLGPKTTNVYLQQNCITRIQNLDCLPNLQFLTLAGNHIRTVENLQHLSCLLLLDLSENFIDDFDTGDFPQSLIILNLARNPCSEKPNYRDRVIHNLAKLKQLDGTDISRQEKLEAGFQVSSDELDEDEEEEEEGASYSQFARPAVPTLGVLRPKLPDIEVQLKDVANEMLLRSQDRVEETLQVHRRHIIEIDNLRLKNSSQSRPGIGRVSTQSHTSQSS